MLAKLSPKNSADVFCCPPFLLDLDKNKEAHLLSTCVFLVNDGVFQFDSASEKHTCHCLNTVDTTLLSFAMN